MNKKMLILMLPLLCLTSCNEKKDVSTIDFSIYSPAGAPALAIYQSIIDGKATTTSDPKTVAAQLQNDDTNYDFCVFESATALKLIKAGKSNFTFAKLLTSGNLHLAGINKTSTDLPKVGDKIVYFGSGVTTDTIKYCFPEIFADSNKDNVFEPLASAALTAAVMQTGMYNNVNVDYVFTAEPVLFASQKANENIIDLGNINAFVSEKSSGKFDFVPQAALFVKNSFLEENKENYDAIIVNIEEQMNDAINDPSKVKDAINTYLLDETDQKEKFGFSSTVAYNIQKDNKNLFGVADSENDINVATIKDYLSTINSTIVL